MRAAGALPLVGALALALGALAGSACRKQPASSSHDAAATADATTDAGPAAAPTTLRLHLPAEPAHLNPLLASDFLTTQVVLGDVWEPLFTLDARGAIVPVLAAQATLDADGRRLRVRLRDGATWADGQPVTSDDVRFTFELLRTLPSALAADVDDLERVDTPDAHTAEIVFAGFRLERAESLALVPIVPRHVFAGVAPEALVAHERSRLAAGSGPYVVAAWEPGREIRLRRRDDLPPARAAALPRDVVYRVVPDRAQAVAQLAAGELDVIFSLAPGPLQDDAVRGGRARLVEYDFPYYLAVRWNCRRGALADARVRRALTMLLDRETVRREVLRGRGRLASAPWPPEGTAYDAAIAPWPFDPAAAQALLAAAGHARPRVRLLVPTGSVTLERIATLWQADARAAGVTLDVVPDADPIGRARRGDFDAIAYGWTTSSEMDMWHHFHTRGPDNYGACATPALDDLLAAIRSTADPAARAALEHRAHAALHDLAPATIIVLDVRVAAVSSRITAPGLGPHGAPVSRMRF